MARTGVRIQRRRSAVIAVAALSTALMFAAPRSAAASSGAAPGSITIGVDHADLANQQPQNGRLFEYTDFFSRSATVHRGDTIDFQTAPFAFHIIGLARDERKARAVYPVVYNEKDDPNAPSGAPKIGFGSSNFPILNGSTSNPAAGQVDFTRPNGPPLCGVTGEATCVFSGGNQVQVAGPNSGPAPADWNVKIDAPVGTYHFFCYIHPQMSGVLHVVGGDKAVTTQAQINKVSAEQFASSRAQALDVEAHLNVIRHSDGQAGHRTFWVRVGAAAANNHVAIDEMLPNPQHTGPLPLVRGDRVVYLWADGHNVHSVLFPATPPTFSSDVPPFGFDCASGYVPAGAGPPCPDPGEPPPSSPPFNPPFELIADPGNAAPGTVVSSPTQLVDSGVRVGEDYGLNGSETWSVRTDSSTTPGTTPYLFHCTIHDFMVGAFVVSH